MGIFSDNFYSWLNRGAIYSDKPVMDANPEWDENKYKRGAAGSGKGGQFVTKPETIEKQDDLSATLKKTTLTLPNGKEIDKDYATLYSDEEGKLRDGKYSPFLKTKGGDGTISPEMDKALDRLFSGEDISDAEIKAIPEWAKAMAQAKELEDRLQQVYGVSDTSQIDTPERKRMRARITKAALSDTIKKTVPIEGMDVEFETNEGLKDNESYKVEQGHEAVIAIGFPAAGKSTTFANPLAKKYKARLCDSDTIKKVLPEFANGYGGNLVHKESTNINEEVLKNAVEKGDNVVYPILGYDQKKLGGVIKKFKDKGYKVTLCYKDMPVNMAKGRLLVRFLQKGRYLPLECISKAQGTLAQSFDANKEMADSFVRSTNTKPYGGEEKVLEEKV